MSIQYSNGHIFCSCGDSFYVGLEDRLAERLWESYDHELSDEELYACPSCRMQFQLEIVVEKTVVTSFRKLTPLGQLMQTEDGQIGLSMLKGAAIGDLIQFRNMDDEFVLFPDGIYVVDEKEYAVKDGIVMNYWGISDQNQMNLFEECVI